jgi:hypothetical protein
VGGQPSGNDSSQARAAISHGCSGRVEAARAPRRLLPWGYVTITRPTARQRRLGGLEGGVGNGSEEAGAGRGTTGGCGVEGGAAVDMEGDGW